MDDFGARLVAEMPQLRRYAQALTRDTARAEDLTQTCLMRALVKQNLWQAGTNLRSWLMTMMHNQHVSEIRRSRREVAGSGAFAATVAAHVRPAADDVVLLSEVETAIAGLPETQQPIVVLACLEDLDYRHVAARLQIPEGTVRSRLSRARASLRAMVDDGDRDGGQPGRDRSCHASGGRPRKAGRAGPPAAFAAHPPGRKSPPRSAGVPASAAAAS